MDFRFFAALCLSVFAFHAKADPIANTYYSNEKGAVLFVENRTEAGFDFSLLSQQDCPEGETTCLFVMGTAEATPKGWTWADGNSRIFFAATEDGVRILQTAGDLGAGTANRAAKLNFPGTYAPFDERATEDTGDLDYKLIQSPTGNIGCMFVLEETSWVRCDLAELTPSFPETPADCDFDYGRAFGISGSDTVGEVLCYSDTVLDPGAEVLAYGDRITVGDITCWSEKTGLTCENAQGHGFKLSRKKQEVY